MFWKNQYGSIWLICELILDLDSWVFGRVATVKYYLPLQDPSKVGRVPLLLVLS